MAKTDTGAGKRFDAVMLVVRQPTEARAIRWTGDNFDAVAKFAGAAIRHPVVIDGEHWVPLKKFTDSPWEAHYAREGDWIVEEAPGQYTPMRPDAFSESWALLQEE